MANSNEARTKVTYDTSQATAAIKQLAKDTEKASDSSQSAFDSMTKGAQKLSDGYGSAASNALKLARGAVGFGPTGVALAATAAAAAALAANLLDVPALLRSSAEQARSFATALADAAKLRESLFKYQDSGDELEFSKRAIALKASANELNLKRQETREKRAELDQQLSDSKSHFSQLVAAAREAQSSLQSGERRLADLQDARLEREGSTMDLLRQARKLQSQGDPASLDRAKGLIDAAGARQNDSYDQQAVTDALKSYEKAAERSVNTDRQRVSTLAAMAQASGKQIQSINAEADALKKRALAEQGQATTQKNDRRTLQIDRAKDDAADEGVLARGRLADAMAKLGEATDRERTKLEKGRDAFSGVVSMFTGGAKNYASSIGQITSAQDELVNIQSLLKAGDFEKAVQPIERFRTLMTELGKKQDILPDVQKFNFDALKDGAAALNEVLEAKGAINANDKSIQEIGLLSDPMAAANVSSEGIFANLSGAATAARSLAQSLVSIRPVPSAGAQASANAGDPTGAGAAVAAVGPSPVNQNITVTLQGGMMDNATIQQFVQAVQRQARLGIG